MSRNIQVRQNRFGVKLKEVKNGVVLAADTSAVTLALAVVLGITTSPVVGVAAATLSFVGLTNRLFELYNKRKEKKKLTLKEFVDYHAILSYLESFDELNLSLALPSNVRQDAEFKKFEVNEKLAPEALTCFHKSTLGRAYNRVLSRFLEEGGLNSVERKILAGWVGWKTEA